MSQVSPLEIIYSYYDPRERACEILIRHSHSVAEMAIEIADRHPEWKLDREFVYEAAMLHDIGIRSCYAPGIGCHGKDPYILHGVRGAEMLRSLDLERHARVCERHVGTGISYRKAIEMGWDLPERDMLPITLEEQIVCFADKFYSKSNDMQKKSLERIEQGLQKYGEDDVERFRSWCRLFL